MKHDIKQLMLMVERKLVKTAHQKPSKETLDHLAIFAGFQDWSSFRETLKEDEKPSQSTNLSSQSDGNQQKE